MMCTPLSRAASAFFVALAGLFVTHATASGGPPATFDGLPIEHAAASGAASGLAADVDCSTAEARKAAVTLAWSVARPAGSAQRVLVSIYGFREGRFEASEPLAGEQATLAWKQVHGQAIHSWLVLTRQGATWKASPVETFTGPTCIADFQPAPRR